MQLLAAKICGKGSADIVPVAPDLVQALLGRSSTMAETALAAMSLASKNCPSIYAVLTTGVLKFFGAST